MTSQEEFHEPAGIGGWLMFRVLQMLLFAPAGWIISFVRTAHSVLLWETLPLVIVGSACGIFILLRKPVALEMSAIHLALLAIYKLTNLWGTLHGKTIYGAEVGLTNLALNLAMYVAWFLYFRFSVRVRNTFGRNLLEDRVA